MLRGSCTISLKFQTIKERRENKKNIIKSCKFEDFFACTRSSSSNFVALCLTNHYYKYSVFSISQTLHIHLNSSFILCRQTSKIQVFGLFSCSKNSISSRDRAQIHDEKRLVYLGGEIFIHLMLQPEANQNNYYQNVIKHKHYYYY